MKRLRSFIHTEKSHFDRLQIPAQKLVLSIFFYNLSGPILSLFVNAFLLRSSQNFVTVAVYNLCLFLAVPIGFYINGLLFRKVSISNLYTLGFLIESIVGAYLVFQQHITIELIACLGFIYGIGVGIYWANRNLLTLKTTQSNNRIYFSGLESTSDTIAEILIPAVTGWFISFGTASQFYTLSGAYKIILLFVLFLVIAMFFFIRDVQVVIDKKLKLFLSNITRQWRKFQAFEFITGFMGGLNLFLPVLMIFTFLGKEGILGIVQSAVSIITAVVVYLLAKKLHIRHRLHLLLAGVVFAIIGALSFMILYSGIGVIIFMICASISTPLFWISMSSLTYDLIDTENKDEKLHFAYVSDQEIYLNLGRILAIGIFIYLTLIYSNNAALRFTPVVLAFSEIVLFLFAKSIESKHVLKYPHEPRV